jgi:hypothetical protein
VTTLDDFVKRRTEAADRVLRLCDRLAAEPELAPVDRVGVLRSLAARTREGRFVVFLVGCFSSGKSTLLNALLGAPALPVKVNPCTAILTEVTFAPAPQVEVHFRDGHTEVLAPDVFLARYQLTTAEDAAGAEADDRFGSVAKAVVGYPLPLLANGVVLLDTPGLDDDPRRTARTLTSLPDADAVIFVLSANRFLTDLERRTLTRDLLPLGLTNLFFPVTMVDLLQNLTDDPGTARREIELRGREFLAPLASGAPFERRFFLLDARSALLARWDRDLKAPRTTPDSTRLGASGIEPFEEALETFLVEERGAVQLRSLAAATTRLRDDLERRAALDRATAADTVEELRRRQTELEPSLRQLEAISRRVERTVDSFVERQQALVWQELRSFVVQTEAELPDAVAGFDLGDLAGFDLFTPKGRSRVEAALHQALEKWLDERMGTWQASLRPRIERSLGELRAELVADADDFDALAARIVTDFAGGALSLPSAAAAGPEPTPIERWFSVAMGAVLLSPGTMAAGWADGYEGAMKGAAGRLGVRLAILALGALLGPVGWAGMVLYAITDAVLVVLTGGSRLKRLRDGVAQALKGRLVAQVDAARDDIAARVREGLAPLRDGLVAAARSDAEELRGALARTVQARERLQRDASRRAEAWEHVLAAFTDEAAG